MKFPLIFPCAFILLGFLSAYAQDRQVLFPLHDAAAHNDRRGIRQLISEGIDLNTLDTQGRTALLIALEQDHFKTADWLISQGADPTQKDRQGRSSLFHAISRGNKAIAMRLILGGFDPNDHDDHGQSVLELAALRGWADVVELLIDKGAIAFTEGPIHRQPAYLAGKQGYFRVVKRLGKRQPAPFFIRAFYASPRQMRASLQKPDISINNRIPETGESLLHLACYGGNRRLVGFLLKSGIHPDLQDHSGKTALHAAASNGHLKCVELLLRAGANREIRDRNGYRAVDIAEAMQHRRIMKRLHKQVQ